MDAAAVTKSDRRIHVCGTRRWGQWWWWESKTCDTLRWLLFFLLTQTKLAWKVFALEKVSDTSTGPAGLFVTSPGEKALWGSRGPGRWASHHLGASAVAAGTDSLCRYRFLWGPIFRLELEQFQDWCSLCRQGCLHFEALRIYVRNYLWGFSWIHNGRKVERTWTFKETTFWGLFCFVLT